MTIYLMTKITPETVRPITGKKKEKVKVEIHCNCHFCKGGIQREDVQHYKIALPDEPTREYFVQISDTDRQMQIIPKY